MKSLDEYAEDLDDLQDAAQKVIDAWVKPGRMPLVHSLAVGALWKEWPTLAIAIDDLVKEQIRIKENAE